MPLGNIPTMLLLAACSTRPDVGNSPIEFPGNHIKKGGFTNDDTLAKHALIGIMTVLEQS